MVSDILKADVLSPEESRTRPKYGLGELPVEYTPLNSRTIKESDSFGPVSFRISTGSHKHHLEFIGLCTGCQLANHNPLYAFEFWPLPRVMSQWRFGRLNEVISVRAERIIKDRPTANEQLIGQTTVRAVTVRNGLCFGFFDSVVRTMCGDVCMTAEDVLLLANGCEPNALKEAVAQALKNKTSVGVESASSMLGAWSLHMRYAWPESKWRNNIHTATYAKTLGYERGLVEGPGVADVVYEIDSVKFGTPEKFRLSWKYVAPLYDGTAVSLVGEPSSNASVRRYSVCESPSRLPAKCRVLLEVELEALS